LHELYKTYEAYKAALGTVELNRWKKGVQLLPIAHAFQNVQVEVTVQANVSTNVRRCKF